ncbi:hypothetical protein [Nonomuraea mesophila]|nr:hypothetical protein [Nonomuraea mesophila]
MPVVAQPFFGDGATASEAVHEVVHEVVHGLVVAEECLSRAAGGRGARA